MTWRRDTWMVAVFAVLAVSANSTGAAQDAGSESGGDPGQNGNAIESEGDAVEHEAAEGPSDSDGTGAGAGDFEEMEGEEEIEEAFRARVGDCLQVQSVQGERDDGGAEVRDALRGQLTSCNAYLAPRQSCGGRAVLKLAVGADGAVEVRSLDRKKLEARVEQCLRTRVSGLDVSGRGDAAEMTVKIGLQRGTESDCRCKPDVSDRMELGDLETSGGGDLQKDRIKEVLNGQTGEFETCAEQTLMQDPAATGEMTVKFTVGIAGRVTHATAADATFGDGTGACIARRVDEMRFPRPKGGELQVEAVYVIGPGT